MKPQIDAMYTGRSGGAAVVGGPSTVGQGRAQGPAGIGGLLAGIAGKAAGPPAGTTADVGVEMKSSASSLMIITNPTSFDACLASHPNSIALFRPSSSASTRSSSSSTSISAVEEKFEEMAREETPENKVDLDYLVVDVDVGKGREVADKCGVQADELERGPVVVLFRQGVKVR